MATTAFDVVLKEINDTREPLIQALASGAVKDFAEYRFLTGQIRGLALAEGFITDLVRRMTEDDE